MSIVDLFESEDYKKRRDAFHADLGAIEQKYSYWFEQRPGILPGQEHDKMGNHYHSLRDTNKNTYAFWFNDDSPVPQEIIEECMAALNQHFGGLQ